MIETSEKLGEEFTQKQLEDTNTIYIPTNYNVTGTLTFNELGNVLDKQDFPNTNEKSVYTYDKSNRISTVTDYFSDVKNQKYSPTSTTTFLYKQDTIVATITRLKDKTEKPLKITRIYKNNLLQSEYTDSKSINHYYDEQGTLVKKVGARKKDNKINIANYHVKYEDGVVSSDFCPEKKITKTYYSNGLQKSFVSDEINQKYNYTYDQNGNWITNTVSNDSKPTTKYFRKITYFE